MRCIISASSSLNRSLKIYIVKFYNKMAGFNCANFFFSPLVVLLHCSWSSHLMRSYRKVSQSLFYFLLGLLSRMLGRITFHLILSVTLVETFKLCFRFFQVSVLFSSNNRLLSKMAAVVAIYSLDPVVSSWSHN